MCWQLIVIKRQTLQNWKMIWYRFNKTSPGLTGGCLNKLWCGGVGQSCRFLVWERFSVWNKCVCVLLHEYLFKYTLKIMPFWQLHNTFLSWTVWSRDQMHRHTLCHYAPVHILHSDFYLLQDGRKTVLEEINEIPSSVRLPNYLRITSSYLVMDRVWHGPFRC